MTLRVHTTALPNAPAALEPSPALPPEWRIWAEEPAHQVVIEDGGEAVGALHVALVSASEAWLEGLRVRRDHQGRAIGRRLVAAGEDLARRYGAQTTRTAIPRHEYAAQAVAERAGYRSVTRAVVYERPAPRGPEEMPYDAPVDEAAIADLRVLLAWLDRNEALLEWRGLLPLGWRFRQVRPELIRGLIRDRRVFLAGEGVGGEVLGAALFGVHDGDVVISLLAGSPPQRQALAGAVAERARAQGATRMVLFAGEEAQVEPLRGDWRAHGWCPDGLTIVERVQT